jgi:hypothetical protein
MLCFFGFRGPNHLITTVLFLLLHFQLYSLITEYCWIWLVGTDKWARTNKRSVSYNNVNCYEARTLLRVGVSVSDTVRVGGHRHDTYDYTELCHFSKLSSVSPCQCPCRVWCPCQCLCFIDNIWSTDTDSGYDTDTDTSIPIIIWENDIIQCNHKYLCWIPIDTTNPRIVCAS